MNFCTFPVFFFVVVQIKNINKKKVDQMLTNLYVRTTLPSPLAFKNVLNVTIMFMEFFSVLATIYVYIHTYVRRVIHHVVVHLCKQVPCYTRCKYKIYM